MKKNILIDSFSLAGYRSFGGDIQRFDRFSKINLFIGQNNCGKSNVLKYIHDVLPLLAAGKPMNLAPLDRHIPTGARFVTGFAVSLETDEKGEYSIFSLERMPHLSDPAKRHLLSASALRVFRKKSELDGLEHVWFDFDSNLELIESSWKEAFNVLSNDQLYALWHSLTKYGGGSKEQWYVDSLKCLTPSFKAVKAVLIPAIRKVGEKDPVSDDFSGAGIIERLVRLQNPDVHNQQDRKKFSGINRFLQNVTDNTTATIEIPHERNTILVHMDGKTLPLESLGTGVHEVIILASAATVLENTAICMEEPELHLNPILQRKLIRYLVNSTNNQYFITTHSAVLMDTPNVEIYHINLEQGASKARRVTSDRHRSEICEDLGYHPSDLLQANCIIWVEGPSDRIYLNFWIHSLAPQLIEGIHYSIMFYGGRLASHLSANDLDERIEDFISLRRLNRRSAIVIDSDAAKPRARVNATKLRLKKEFNAGQGFAWITEGREIENYLPAEYLKKAINETKPSATLNSSFGQYENTLSIITKGGKESQASKVDVAKYITEQTAAEFKILDLNKQMRILIGFIEGANPSTRIE